MKNIITTLVLALLLTSAFPQLSFAQSTSFQPTTAREMIAYLMGQIQQLQNLKAMLERAGNPARVVAPSAVSYVTVDTFDATEETDVSAALSGEVLLFGDATAQTWFEYGQDEDFLDSKTSKKNAYTPYDRAQKVIVTRLEPDEKYFFRIVALTNDDQVLYGSVATFRTDEDPDEDDDDDN